jgi:hypothetical protein
MALYYAFDDARIALGVSHRWHYQIGGRMTLTTALISFTS